MNTLLIATVSNVVVAALMAVVVIGISRFCKRPALIHSLWVLVLLKLVTPPVVHVPMPFAVWDAPRPAVSAPSDAPANRAGTRSAVAKLDRSPPAAPLPVQGMSGEILDVEWPDDEPGRTLLKPLPGGGVEVAVEPSVPKRKPGGFAAARDAARSAGTAANLASRPASRTAARSPASSEARAASPDGEAESWGRLSSLPVVADTNVGPTLPILVGGWVAGSLFWLLVTGLRIVWFRHLLKHAEAAPHSLQLQTADLAGRLGLARAPEVRLLRGAVSPMLWAGGRRPLLLFPRELLARLDERSRAMLLLHELAHLRRGDHWVRFLELLASGLYWWNPVVWWARREIHRTEEECCDALVVQQSRDGGHTYAAALLDTIDFLAGAKPLAVPPATSGIGQVKFVRHRLKQIFDGTTSGLLSRTTRLAVLLAAVTLLPLLPTFAGGDSSDGSDVESTAANKAPSAKKSDDSTKPGVSAPGRSVSAGEPLEFETSPRSLQFSPLECRTVDVSSDGRWLASGHGKWTTEGRTRVWDLKTRKEVAMFPEKGGISSVRFSPDGKLLASACWGEGIIRIRELPSLKERHAFPVGNVARLAFSPDGKTLAAATESAKLLFWDVKTGKSQPPLEGTFFRMQYVTYSKDGRYLAVCGGKFDNPRNGRVAVWDLKTKKQLEIRKLSAPVISVAFSPDGKTLAACGFDRRVHAYGVPSMKELFTLAGSPSYLECVNFTPDGKTLLSTGYDGVVQLSNPRTGESIGTLAGHPERGTMWAAVSSDSKTIYTCGIDSTIRIWDATTYKQSHVLRPGETAAEVPEPVLFVAASPTGDVIASAHEDRTIRLRDPETGAVLRTLRGHEDVVAGLAFTSDGKTLASAGFDKTIRLWNVADGKLLRTLKGHTNWVFAVAFTPDDKRLISGAYDKTLRVWNVADGKPVATLKGHTATVRSLAISADGKWIASGSGDKTVKLWDAKTLKAVHTLEGHKGTVRAVAFSPDGETLASASEDKTIKQWSVADGKEIRTLEGHTGMVWTLAWSPRGATLASGGFDNTLMIWDPRTGRRRQTLRGHTDVVTSLAFAPGNKGLITGSYDKSIRFWKGKQRAQRELLAFAAHPDATRAVEFSRDGRWMATGGHDGLVKLWSMQTGRVAKTFRGHAGGVRTVAFSPDGRRIASAGWGRSIIIWNITTGKKEAAIPVARHDVMCVRFTPDGRKLVSCGRDKTARVWDMASFKQLYTTPAQPEVLSGLDVSPDGTKFVTCSGDYKKATIPGIARLWDLKTGRELAMFAGHRMVINCVRFSPDGKRIATGGRDGTKLWDVATRRLIRDIMPNRGVQSLAFLPDGRALALARPNLLSIRNAETGKQTVAYAGHKRATFGVTPSPDGSILATAAGDGSVKFWPLAATGKLRSAIEKWRGSRTIPTVTPGATATIQDRMAYCTAASPDFKTLAITSQNKTVRVVETATGKLLRTFEGHTDQVLFAAYSPDGKTLATSGYDKTIRLWDLATGESRAVLRGHAGRVSCVRFTPDGTKLISCGMQGRVFAWDPKTGKKLGEFPRQQAGLIRIAVSHDGKLLAGSGWGKAIHLWSIDDYRHLANLQGHTERVTALAFSPDGRTLVSGQFSKGPVKAIRVWDVPTRSLRVLPNYGIASTSAISFSPDGKTFVTSGVDRLLRFWDAETSQLMSTVVSGHAVDVRSLLWSPDGKQLVSTCLRGLMRVWNIGDSRIPWIPGYTMIAQNVLPVSFDRTLVKHEPQARNAAFSPDGSMLATCGDDKLVKLWDAGSLSLKRTLKGHRGAVIFVAFSPDNRILASASSDRTARLWDPDSGKLLRVLKGHTAGLRQVRFSPDGKHVVTAAEDRTARIWETATGKLLETIKTDQRGYSVAISPDGKRLAVGTGDWKTRADGSVTLYAFPSGRRIKELPGAKGAIWALAFLPEGRRLAVANANKLGVTIWNVASGKRERVLHFQHGVKTLRMRPNGRWLIAGYGYRHGATAIWDVESGKLLCRVRASEKPISSADVSRDGKTIATAALDGSVKIYRLENGKEETTAAKK